MQGIEAANASLASLGHVTKGVAILFDTLEPLYGVQEQQMHALVFVSSGQAAAAGYGTCQRHTRACSMLAWRKG